VPKVSLIYVICTSPRSGSTLLCNGLTNTGRAGAPAEFFDHRVEVTAYWMSRFGFSRTSQFADRIVAATSTRNGVFGTKLHWTTRPAIHRAFCQSLPNQVDDFRHRSLDDVLQAKFLAVHYIWRRRRNKVAQGISHFRADRSDRCEIPRGHRLETSGASDSVVFDFRMIDHCIRNAIEYDREWENHFARHRLTPLQLIYEDFVASYDKTLRRVLDFIDVAHNDLPEAEPGLERMADAKSLEWEEKYTELRSS
jgi:LPS sulfotransferase NodH